MNGAAGNTFECRHRWLAQVIDYPSEAGDPPTVERFVAQHFQQIRCGHDEDDMRTYNVQEAARDLSALVEAAVHGDDIIITRGGVPVVRLVGLAKPAGTERRFGVLKERLRISEDFDSPSNPDWTR